MGEADVKTSTCNDLKHIMCVPICTLSQYTPIICVASSNHGHYPSFKYFHSMEENKSGELIHREDSVFFISLPAQTQEMSAEFPSAGKRKQATQGRRLEVKIKEDF